DPLGQRRVARRRDGHVAREDGRLVDAVAGERAALLVDAVEQWPRTSLLQRAHGCSGRGGRLDVAGVEEEPGGVELRQTVQRRLATGVGEEQQAPDELFCWRSTLCLRLGRAPRRWVVTTLRACPQCAAQGGHGERGE